MPHCTKPHEHLTPHALGQNTYCSLCYGAGNVMALVLDHTAPNWPCCAQQCSSRSRSCLRRDVVVLYFGDMAACSRAACRFCIRCGRGAAANSKRIAVSTLLLRQCCADKRFLDMIVFVMSIVVWPWTQVVAGGVGDDAVC